MVPKCLNYAFANIQNKYKTTGISKPLLMQTEWAQQREVCTFFVQPVFWWRILK